MQRTDGYLNRDYNLHIIDSEGLSVLGFIGIIVLAIFVVPWASFWLSYFGGWIAKVVIGNQLVKAFSIFGIEISKDAIPWIAGLFGWIGGFIKGISIDKN